MLNSRFHIIIADNQFLITEALQKVIHDEFPDTNCILAGSKHGLIKALAVQPISLVIMDYINLAFENVAEIKRQVLTDNKTEVLLLVNSLQRNELIDLSAVGIKNILLKNSDRNELVMGIKSAMSGKKYYCQEVLDMFSEIHNDKPAARENGSLTYSEVEIVKAIAEGYTTKQIAAKKFISHHTVMTHRKNIFRKLAVKNASELVMFAIRSGIIEAIDYQI
jgi:DNA-binding NarL/FixJ family response regulator